jgi:hypothetical protein
MITDNTITTPANTFNKKDKEAAYQAWKLTVAAGQSTHITQFLLAFPKYVNAAKTTSTKVNLSAEAAWTMLASNQKLINPPRVSYV